MSDLLERKELNRLLDQVIAYESGMMTSGEMIEFFQGLIDTGLAWTLQGHYGRTAAALIDQGYCTRTIGPET